MKGVHARLLLRQAAALYEGGAQQSQKRLRRDSVGVVRLEADVVAAAASDATAGREHVPVGCLSTVPGDMANKQPDSGLLGYRDPSWGAPTILARVEEKEEPAHTVAATAVLVGAVVSWEEAPATGRVRPICSSEHV